MNVNYRALALDPGGTTGWAMYDAELLPSVEDGKVELVDHKLHVGELGPEEHHLKLYQLLERSQIHDFRIICESFEFRQGRQRDNINLVSKEYIGLVKLFRDDRDVETVFQSASLGKGFVDDRKLKAMGWYTKSSAHMRDATRHLVYYLVNKERRYDLIQSWKGLA